MPATAHRLFVPPALRRAGREFQAQRPALAWGGVWGAEKRATWQGPWMPRALSATQGGRGGGQAWPLPWQCAFRPVFRSAFRFAFWPASAARVCRGFRSRGGSALLRPLFAVFYRFAPRLLVGMRGRLAGWLRESFVPNLPIKSANRPQRPWMLRSALSK